MPKVVDGRIMLMLQHIILEYEHQNATETFTLQKLQKDLTRI